MAATDTRTPECGSGRNRSHRKNMSVSAGIPAKCLMRRDSECEGTDLHGGSVFVQVLLPTDTRSNAELKITHSDGCRIRFRHARVPQLPPDVLAVLIPGTSTLLSLTEAKRQQDPPCCRASRSTLVEIGRQST